MEEQYDAEAITVEAVDAAGLSDHYNPAKLYPNPAKNAKFGMSFNWHNNLVPTNVVDLIASHETLGAGLARAAHETLEATVNHRFFEGVNYSNDDKKDWFIGLTQELARRDGLGAFGEVWARENIDLEGELVAPVPTDENKGIDIRTTEATYQVKTGDSFKSNWERKEADHLIWVKTDNNKIVGYEMR